MTKAGVLQYDSSLGVVNSADTFTSDDGTITLVAGNASGFVTIWSGNNGFEQVGAAVDLTSSTPTNPWGLQNIRGVSLWIESSGTARFLTGSENGLICVVQVPSDEVLSKTVYNPSAQRGINAITAFGDNLIVANCSVGANDKNFWHYKFDETTNEPQLVSSLNLQFDTKREQTFNFDLTWCTFQLNGTGVVGAIAATQEGYLWLLQLSTQGMSIVGKKKVTMELGAALAYCPNGQLAATAYNLYNLVLNQPTETNPDAHPNRLPLTLLSPCN